MTSQDNFAVRFAKHKDELEGLFLELYHNREGLEVLEREMAEAYNARSAELKALDKARSADPEWYKRGNMFGMTMYTDLFAGNLKELAKKLPYLKEQKLTYLHLMPLLQMYIIPTSGWSTIPLTKLWAIRIWQKMYCKRCFCTLPKIFLKFIEKTVTNSLLISLVVVEAVHTICFASSEKNRWKKSRTHQMMPRCRMMQ